MTWKVIYPQGGVHLLLQWWESSENNHIILAHSEAAIFTTIKRLFDRDEQFKIIDYRQIEMVVPSIELCAQAEKYWYNEKVKSFQGEIFCRLSEAAEEGYPLPSGVKICEEYQPVESEYCNEDLDLKYHFDCKNCLYKIQLVNLTPEEWYLKYHESWEKLHPKPKDNLVLSRANQVKTDEDLWVTTTNFGPHRPGIELNKLSSFTKNSLFNQGVLFFFKSHQELDRTKIQELIDDLYQVSKEKLLKAKEQRLKLQTIRNQAKFDDLLNLFNSNSN